MLILDPSMPPEQLRQFAVAVAQVGFCAGLLGAAAWGFFASIARSLADWVMDLEVRRRRIREARARAAQFSVSRG